MTLRFYAHSKSKRAEALALIDSGATKNFMSLQYAKYLQLPIKRLAERRRLFNVDRTPNKSGDLEYYMDLEVRTGMQRTNLWFFLSDLGDNKAILGYPWFAAVQPKIDWLRGWLDHSQLPIIFHAPDTAKAQFTPRTRDIPRPKKTQQIYMGRITIGATDSQAVTGVPAQYAQFTKVFSEEESHNFPPVRIWDHVIELKPGAPATIPGKIYSLSQTEQEETHKFIKGHLKRGTI
jgi:hypothetical protein